MCPDSLPRLWRYINLLLTYLLTYTSHLNINNIFLQKIVFVYHHRKRYHNSEYITYNSFIHFNNQLLIIAIITGYMAII